MKINTAGGKEIDIFNTSEFIQYWNDPRNYISTILKQINEDKLYSPYLAGKKDLIMLDIGANIGLVSIFAHDVCAKIIAVEADAEHYAMLAGMTKEYSNIVPLRAALCSKNGPINFFKCQFNNTAHSTIDQWGTLPVEVEGSTLSRLIERFNLDRVDFCKIDIEGSEFIALTVEEIVACKNKIKCWLVEVHAIHGLTLSDMRNIIGGRFLDAGLQPIALSPDTILVGEINE